MAEERLFGNSIDKAVVDEIKKREKLLSKTDDKGGNLLPEDPNTIKALRYTTQRGAWVRLISSVNEVGEAEVRDAFFPEVTRTAKTSDNTKAKNFILTGGEITSDGTKKGGINFDTFDTTKSYRKTATVGVRPEAGITAFSIKHKGTYGSIREAEISFNVWSKEDLDRAQTLYLRPGVHMMVEWGHTIDSEGNTVKLPNENIYFAATSRQQVQDVINAHREANLSYEGFIGLVTNFSWSFREDGGYDCSVRIISTGAVMESLTTIQGAGHLTRAESEDCKGESDEGKIEDSKKSLMHDFILGVKRKEDIFLPGNKTQGGPQFDRKTGTSQRFSQAVQKILNDNNISLYGFYATEGKNVYFRYITIRDLLKFLNASEFIPKDETGETFTKFLIEPDNVTSSGYSKFKTFSEHFSLDIKTCFLPKPPTTTSSVQREKDAIGKIRLSDEVQKSFNNAIFKNQPDNIQSILVELDFLLATFDSAFSSEEDNIYKINVFSFMQNLLRGINNALGNITDLDLHQIDGNYVIVDREAVTTAEAVAKVAELSFTGISNTVQKVSIQTKITPQLTSQIAISAQGTKSISSGDNNSNLAMIQWNAGIEDRFNPKSNAPADPPPTLSNCGGGSTGGTTTSRERLASAQNELKLINDRIQRLGPNRARLKDREERQRTVSFWENQIQREEEEARQRAQFNLQNPFVEDFLEPWADAFESLTTSSIKGWFSFLGSTEYKEELFSRLRRFGIAYFREKYFKSIGGEKNRDKTSDPGLIPIELSITLDGIGGLKIGQVFKLDRVEKFLPEAYKDYGFIITAIDSTIENNKWNTTIKALTFKIPTQSTATSTGSGRSRSTSTSTAASTSSVNRYITEVPWSAGFISFVVEGVVPSFPSNGAHTGYAQSLRTRPTAPVPWQLLDPATTKPIPGDIILRNRGGFIKFNSPVWIGVSHGDIVVSATNDAITFVGGNLSDTTVKGAVKRNRQPVRGGLLPTTGTDFYFVILRPPSGAAAGIVSRANAEYSKWSAGGWTETTPAAYSTIYRYYEAGGIHTLRAFGGVPLTPLPPPTS